jgi:hypothetical protein
MAKDPLYQDLRGWEGWLAHDLYLRFRGDETARKLENLYLKAEKAKGQFDAYMHRIAAPLRGDAQVLTAPNKGKAEAREKLGRGGEAQDPASLKDIVRGTIKCRTYLALYICRQLIEKSAEYRTIDGHFRKLNPGVAAPTRYFKDRFEVGAGGERDGPAGSGYRDCNFTVLIGQGASWAFACELQVQIARLNVVKEYEHPIYEILRIKNKETGASILKPRPDKHAAPGGNNISVLGSKLIDVYEAIQDEKALNRDDLMTLWEVVEKFYPGNRLTRDQVTFEPNLIKRVEDMLPRLYDEYNKKAVREGFISVVEYQSFVDDKKRGKVRSGASSDIARVTAKTGTRDDRDVSYGGRRAPRASGTRYGESPF